MQNLSDDLVAHILAHLSPGHLVTALRVCHLWFEQGDTDENWRRHALAAGAQKGDGLDALSWKRRYRVRSYDSTKQTRRRKAAMARLQTEFAWTLTIRSEDNSVLCSTERCDLKLRNDELELVAIDPKRDHSG